MDKGDDLNVSISIVKFIGLDTYNIYSIIRLIFDYLINDIIHYMISGGRRRKVSTLKKGFQPLLYILP